MPLTLTVADPVVCILEEAYAAAQRQWAQGGHAFWIDDLLPEGYAYEAIQHAYVLLGQVCLDFDRGELRTSQPYRRQVYEEAIRRAKGGH